LSPINSDLSTTISLQLVVQGGFGIESPQLEYRSEQQVSSPKKKHLNLKANETEVQRAPVFLRNLSWVFVSFAESSLHFIRRFRKIAKRDYKFRHVSLSVRMEHLGFYWTDFHEISFLSIFRKSVEKSQVSLKSDSNNWYCTWRPMYIHDSISLVSYSNEKCIGQKLWRKSNAYFMFNLPPRKSFGSWDNVEK